MNSVRRELGRMMQVARRCQRLPLEGPTRGLDADDLATWIGGALRAAGIKFRFVAASTDKKKDYHHVFVEAYEPRSSQWITIDPLRLNRPDVVLKKTLRGKPSR